MLPSLPLSSVAISKCLIGFKCRYDGESSNNLTEYKSCVSFCPEVLGGLTIPRTPCTICGGNGNDVLNGNATVLDINGVDKTAEFVAGAKEVLKICLENGIKAVILKEKSPSCGVNYIYQGKELVEGCGVTASLLKRNGIKIISDKEVLNNE